MAKKVEGLRSKKMQFAQRLNISTTQPPLDVRFCFRKTDNFAALFPLASLLEQFDTLETLQNITLGGNSARAF
jgi:hypothetical protein